MVVLDQIIMDFGHFLESVLHNAPCVVCQSYLKSWFLGLPQL